ncbi:MAG TPA: heavy-metal-associated domain-containing protein [Microbacterium sp.]|nr:heavy-metal-associated domain-containing protein [Microbacterium sp.]
MSEQTFAVQGMTCGHCAAAVTREVRRIDGVDDVQVDVATGTLTVRAAEAVADEHIATAVDEAGYTLVAAR